LWPAVSHETLPWGSRYPPGVASRSELRRHEGPYDAVVVPTIARADLQLPGSIAAIADDATAEVSRFDAEMGGEIAPFTAVLLRSESAASSQIEDLSASARAIAEAELGIRDRHNAAQIVANGRAMDAAIALADNLDSASILAMHHALMADIDPTGAGQWRTEQVWIGGGRLGPHQAMFVPPHHRHVPDAIDDLLRFAARNDIPVLAHAAVVHAQFETIHPFTDGNGRTGRALLHAMLRNKALTRNVTVPISAGLLTDTTTYFAALDAYRAGDPAPIVDRLADASFAAISNGRTLVAELRDLRASWADRVAARSGSTVWRIADLLLRHPVINAAVIARELAIQPANVYRSITPLVEAGVLVEFTDNRRNRVWRSNEVLAALDAFAARAGRRSLPT
jgi:Fic family protein